MNWLKQNWKNLLLIVIAIVAMLVFPYSCKKGEAPAVTPVPEVTPQVIHQYFPDTTQSEARDISRQIVRAKTEQAPQYHYYTITQEAADEQAQEYGEQQKADKIIKETHQVEVKDDKTGEKTQVIENSYYGINLERKHRIKAGAAMIDNSAYLSLGYQNRDVEYKVYYSPQKNNVGVGVEVTIAKW
jgi:hypothetical protein